MKPITAEGSKFKIKNVKFKIMTADKNFEYIENNLILKKSLDFSIEVINYCKILRYKFKEYSLADQLLRSATSIGANANEAVIGSSKKDFINKMNISLKEAYETRYWLIILWKTDYLKQHSFLINQIEEIIRILVKIVKTSKENENSK
ncbi:MAG: four helix bundle protein [Candidatus Cloacimonadota bacterium]|nr:four helix bundle protein [Candidatus Cloacimonadota bacterium]